MTDPNETRLLAERCRAGDQEAAQRLFDRYVDRLVGLARARLSQRMASRVDPEDIVQSVFRTFFGRLKAGEFKFDQQDDLCKLLVRITVNKTLQEVAFQQAAKRNAGKELGQGDTDRQQLLDLMDSEPTPQTAVAFLDQLEHFLNRMQPEERQVIELRLQGYSSEEIAQQLGTYDRKIRRILERIRGMAEREGWAV